MSNSFYVFIESLKSTYQAGGVVMLPILLVGTIGFYYLFSSWFRIGSDFFKQDLQRVIKNLRQDLNGDNGQAAGAEVAVNRLKKRRGILSRELRFAIEQAQKNPEGFRDDVRDVREAADDREGNPGGDGHRRGVRHPAGHRVLLRLRHLERL